MFRARARGWTPARKSLVSVVAATTDNFARRSRLYFPRFARNAALGDRPNIGDLNQLTIRLAISRTTRVADRERVR